MKGPWANDRRSPLPRQTGHGDFPHPAFARVVSSRRRSQSNQSEMVQVSIQADALSGMPNGRILPLAFGIDTRRTAWAR